MVVVALQDDKQSGQEGIERGESGTGNVSERRGLDLCAWSEGDFNGAFRREMDGSKQQAASCVNIRYRYSTGIHLSTAKLRLRLRAHAADQSGLRIFDRTVAQLNADQAASGLPSIQASPPSASSAGSGGEFAELFVSRD